MSVEHTALEFSEGSGLEIPESCVLFELRRLDETSSGHRKKGQKNKAWDIG